MATTESTDPVAAEAPTPAKRGMLGLIVPLIVVTAVGGGAGAFLAMGAVETVTAVATKRANELPAADQKALAWDKATTVAPLSPVIVNLATPAGARVRIDAAMLFDVELVEDVEKLKALVQEDVLAFMRTLALSDLTGASALSHLRDDLNERVRVVSAGTVHELLIEGLVLQ